MVTLYQSYSIGTNIQTKNDEYFRGFGNNIFVPDLGAAQRFGEDVSANVDTVAPQIGKEGEGWHTQTARAPY